MLKTLPGVAMSSFRPQYFTGYGSNKDCEEYFFDRLVRGRPVCVPGSGDQLSVVAHAEDVATMIAAAVGNDAAAGQVFNAVTNKVGRELLGEEWNSRKGVTYETNYKTSPTSPLRLVVLTTPYSCFYTE